MRESAEKGIPGIFTKSKMESRKIPKIGKYSYKISTTSLFFIFAIFVGNSGILVVGQSTPKSIISNSSCVCGVDRVPCAKSLTSSDCPNGRVISRRDCPCCFLCAKQLTDECNNEEKLCDSDYGLECGTDKRCKAKTQCSDDTDCPTPGDLMCVGGACADPCKVLPDVCKEANMTNGNCVARNHRALCNCSPGTSLNSEKECVTTIEEGKKCEAEGRQINSGETTYTEHCKKSCKCETTGELFCEDAPSTPSCKSNFIPMSNITGEMTDTCKILIGNDSLFDGCCVPEQCQVIKSQDHANEDSKGGRDFKLTESHNNLGEDDKSKLKIESTKDLDDGSSSSSLSNNNEALKAKELMQIIVLKRNDHSAVVSLPKSDNVAILSIVLSKDLIENPGSHELWKEHKIPPGLPQITLSTLLPNTSYTLKYAEDGKEYPTVQFITDESFKSSLSSSEENMSMESSSESKDSSEVSLKTTMPINSTGSEEVVAPTTIASSEMGTSMEAETTMLPASSVGCLYNGTSYEIGDVFYAGCEERCECLKGGEVKCIERCSIPLFKKGSFIHDKMCFEEPSGIDDCCVLIACARTTPHGRAEEGREIVAIMPQPCDSVKCGQNAHCLGPAGILSDEEQQTNQTLCVCDDGKIGDPYDEVHGCQSSVTPTSASVEESSSASSASPSSTVAALPTPSTTTLKSDGCVFKNKTYEYGEEQLDDCSYKCRCETSGEFLCVPRCNYRRDEEKEIPAGCEVQKDPSDLNCCEMLICNGKPLESGTRKETPAVPADGCVYKNTTFARDEKFYDGCEQQCMCFSNGDITCQPRCPPAASNSSGNDCVTLPDPLDKCCTVTLCGNATLSDVMKAANATELTTIAPAQGEARSSQPKTSYSIRISLIHPLNETTVMVAVRVSGAELKILESELLSVEYSHDEKKWSNTTVKVKDAIKTGRAEITVPVANLKPNTEYFFKAKIGEAESNTAAGFTKYESLGSLEDGEFTSSEFSPDDESSEMDATTEEDSAAVTSAEKQTCTFKEKKYEYGEGFYDNCDAYCKCISSGKTQCVKIECPSDGYDLLDDTCVKWVPDPKFRSEAPSCCPKMICVQHSSCTLEGGVVIRNFDEVPQKISGCDRRCYCEFGNVTCQPLCPAVSEHPPQNLPCPKEFAVVMTIPENECCYHWSCRMPQIPSHHLHNLTELDGSKDTLEPTKLNKSRPTTPTPTRPQLNNTNPTATRQPPIPQGFPNNFPHIHHNHPHNSPHENNRFRPRPPRPPTGTPPSLDSLANVDKLNPHQLQELLHHLATLGEGPVPDQIHGGAYPQNAGTYVQVQTPQQVRELEKELGAKFVEQAEDGSYVLMIPNNYDDQSYSDHLEHGHGPPYSHAPPPPQGNQQFPFGLGPFQNQGPHGMPHQDRTKVSNIVIHPLNETTLQIDFTVSSILVGLEGHVEVLFTDEFQHKPNPSQWDTKVFQQAEDLIDNTHLQLFLTNLKPDTEYHMQIKVVVVQSEVGANSDVIRVRTPPIAQPTLPPEILVDPELQLRLASSNSVKLNWRKFTELENNLIDGVQITYKANDDKVYSTTSLIHRSLHEYELENLHPDKEYEINILFIPFDSNQTSVLKSEKPIFVHTTPLEDEYAFDIAVSHGKITETTVELNIEGIPHPEDKFVNIYQVIYMSDPQKEQKDYFKVPKRETSKKATLTDLKPGTTYTIFLEAFLSNGKKKRSNVISIQTKAGELPHPEMSGQENLPQDMRASEEIPQYTTYYGALVSLAIVATIAIIGVIALLMILIKKQSYAKAPINDRKSESSYENPSFKSYDVESNSNGHMKPSEL